MFFTANPGDYDVALYVSDGSSAGTSRLLSTTGGSGSGGAFDLVAFGGELFCDFEAGYISGIWKSDGTPSGTSPVWTSREWVGHVIGTTRDKLYFEVAASDDGYDLRPTVGPTQLWVTDGTTAGTRMVIQFGDHQNIIRGASIGKRFVFTVSDENSDGYQVWRTDGSKKGTYPLLNDGLMIASSAIGGSLLFTSETSAGDRELWATDGLTSGTIRLQHIPGTVSPGSYGGQIAAMHDQAVFTTADPERGSEIWVTDGTEKGTGFLKDIRVGAAGSNPRSLIASADGETVFFIADNGASGESVWRTDGTPGGTVMLKHLAAPSTGTQFSESASSGGRVFFSTQDLNGGEGLLWTSDGTAAGTVVFSSLTVSSYDVSMAIAGKDLFFPAYDSVSGDELRKFNVAGSISGTVFSDLNGNSVRDSGEPGIARSQIFLDLNGDGAWNRVEPSAKSSSTGRFAFSDLAPGAYTLRQSHVAGFAATTPESYRVTVTALGSVIKKFGITPGGSISGVVFNDANGNGLRDSDEAGLANFRVWIDLDNDGVLDLNEPTAHTNSAGRYVIADILPGNYRIRQKLKGGWAITTQRSFGFTLSAGRSSTKRFGDRPI